MKGHVGVWAAVLAVVAMATACASPAAEERPTATPGADAPLPTAAPSVVEAVPHLTETEEQFRQEFSGSDAPRRQWRETDFRRHSVDLREFIGGGPPKDGIPAIDRPSFVSVQEADQWLEDPEPVQVVDIDGDVRAYPLQILIWHELVNDVVGGEPVVVTY